MSLGLGGTEFLGIIPYDLYSWPIPHDNGRLERDYLAAILATLPK